MKKEVDDFLYNCCTCLKGKNQVYYSYFSKLSTKIFNAPMICKPTNSVVPSRMFVCNGYVFDKSLKTTEYCLTCNEITYFDSEIKGLCTICGSFGPEGDFHDPDLNV